MTSSYVKLLIMLFFIYYLESLKLTKSKRSFIFNSPKESTSIHLTKNDMSQEYLSRFKNIARLYGDSSLINLQNSHVCVIGLGGVGSWAVEVIISYLINFLKLE